MEGRTAKFYVVAHAGRNLCHYDELLVPLARLYDDRYVPLSTSPSAIQKKKECSIFLQHAWLTIINERVRTRLP